MAPSHSLRDIFASLADPAGAAADPATALREGGHGDLPDGLVAEAIVSYAGTAPVEVAEHLAPFVAAHAPVPVTGPDPLDPADGLALLASAPAAALTEPEPALVAGEETGGDFGAGELPAATGADPMDLDFGEGAAGFGEAREPNEKWSGEAREPNEKWSGEGEEGAEVDGGLEPTFEAPGLAPAQPEPEPAELDQFPAGPAESGPADSDPAESDPDDGTFGSV